MKRFISYCCALISLANASNRCDKDYVLQSKDYRDDRMLECEVMPEGNDIRKAEDISVDVTDPEAGVVRFELPLQTNDSSHTVHVFVCNETTSGGCGSPIFHSGVKCLLNGTSEQKFYAQFKYIYSARYMIRHISERRTVGEFVQDVATTHKKTDFKKYGVNFWRYYDQETKTGGLLASMDPVFVNKVLKIDFWRNDGSADVTWIIQLREGEESPVICSTNSSMKPLGCIFEKEKQESRDKEYILRCPLQNMEPGVYNYKIDVLHDSRCSPRARIGLPPCSWRSSTNIQNTIMKPKVETETKLSNKLSVTVLLLPLILMTMTVILIYVVISRYRRKHTEDLLETGQLPKTCETKKCKVLLLYAQDCQPFMDMMELFRKFLEKSCGFEVYDYFDPNRFNEIAASADHWIQHHMSQQNTKVIVVENKTALYHQEALCGKFVVHYSNRRTFSHLFPYALKLMTHHLQDSDYKRKFIVRFDEASKVGLELQPFRRYTLPNHFAALLCAMQDCGCNHQSSDCVVDITDEMKKQIEIYLSFCKNNPNYHQQLFTKVVT